MAENIFTLTIYRIHGEPLKFEVELTQAKKIGLSGDIEQSLSRSAIAIEADGKLYMVPYNNIQHIECDPAPESLPISMIRGARQLKA